MQEYSPGGMFDIAFPPRNNAGGILRVREEWKNSNAIPLTTFPIASLHPLCDVNREKVKFLAANIEKCGELFYPILVVEISSNDWELEKATISPTIYPPPGVGYFYRVQAGCSRLAAAKMLGYEKIEGILTTTKRAIALNVQWVKDKTWRNI